MTQSENGIRVFECKQRKKNPAIGKSLIAFANDYTVIDLETTGLNPDTAHIIEYAAVKIRNGEVIDTFQSLCAPGYPIPAEIENLTGITTHDVKGCPAPDDVLPAFLDFTGGDFIVGHNVLFDVRFIAKSSGTFKNSYIDTMKIFRKLHPSLPHHRLSDMVDFYKKSNRTAHRALSDCFATADCYEAMKEDAVLLFGNLELFFDRLK